jgi:hypothetical protein
MNAYLMNKFKLAVAIPLSLGLGVARVLPVQAAAIISPTAASRSYFQPPDSYQFKLDDIALPSPAKSQARGAQTALEPPNWSAQPPAPQTSRAAKRDSAKNQGDNSSEGFFVLVIFATIIAIFYNLISRGNSGNTVASSGSKAGPSSLDMAAIADPEVISPPALDKTTFEEPVAVPTPALLPGLLGLGLKLFRQKKAESQSAVL